MASAARGLTSARAAELLLERGPNELTHRPSISPVRIFLSQLRGPMTLLLFGACAVAALLGEVSDAVAIAAIVVVNAIVGFMQEYRAERAVNALRDMTAPRARVLRDGGSQMIAARDVVPGDVLMLEAGDLVAADAKLLDAHRLTANEASLTGESVPVEKSLAEIAADAPLADRTDRIFAGTAIAAGTGSAEVFATGMNTELGHIAHLLQTTSDTATPLQKRLERVTKSLLVACAGVAVLVATLALLRGSRPLEVLLSAVSLAVAAVPEGLPAVVTVALAIGVQRMVAHHVLVRRLQAVETLGCATVICTDKTGTLTTGVMAVREISAVDEARVLEVGALCSDAELAAEGTSGVGDPTELAILAAARLRGIERAELERAHPRVAVNPFDSERKMMSILRSDGVLYVKGAVEIIVARSTSGTEGALDTNRRLAARGLRVLAVATGRGEEETGLHLVGLLGIADPPRAEAIEAIARARGAGIRTVMITGDHPDTARAIAEELGIFGPNDRVEELVHARATAKEKLEIVRSWKEKGEIVAMTGDGVNDAPALREAHIGIAMGKAGTEVTREAADMILTDDNYASIVAAVEQGRGVYENIRKALVYTLSGNAAELLVMLGASLFGLPLPLLPVHLLWINLMTDGLPGLALVMDPAPDDALSHPPRRPDEPMLGKKQWSSVAIVGALEAVVALGAFAWALDMRTLEAARNMAFSVLVFSQLFRALSFRSETRVFIAAAPFSNMKLLLIVVLSVALQLAIQHVPLAHDIFQLHGVSLFDSALAIGLGLVPVTCVEVSKLVRSFSARH